MGIIFPNIPELARIKSALDIWSSLIKNEINMKPKKMFRNIRGHNTLENY
jgi:hypothetical protein